MASKSSNIFWNNEWIMLPLPKYCLFFFTFHLLQFVKWGILFLQSYNNQSFICIWHTLITFFFRMWNEALHINIKASQHISLCALQCCLQFRFSFARQHTVFQNNIHLFKWQFCLKGTALYCRTYIQVNNSLRWMYVSVVIYAESFNKYTPLHTIQTHKEYICSTWFAYYQHWHHELCFCYCDAFIVVFLHCAACSGNKLFPVWNTFFLRCLPSLVLFHFPSLLLCDSLPSAVTILPICSFKSTFSLLSCTWLMTVWYLSGVPSVPWYALLCHCCCCLVSLSSSSSFSTLEGNRL